MTAAREDLDLRPGYQPRQLLGEIRWGDEVVLGADDQGRRLDPPEALGAVESEDRVDAAGGNLGRREHREVLRLQLPQTLVVPRHEPARIEIQRVRLNISARPKAQQDVLAQPEEPAEISVGLGPAGRQHDASEPVRVLDREDLGDGTAGRMSDDMRALYLQRVHQPD